MISDSDVKKLGRLAHLEVDESTLRDLSPKLNSIIEYIAQLAKLDVTGIEPMSHVHGSQNVLRDDTVQPSAPFDMLGNNLPDRSGRFIRVPIIVE